MNSTDSTHGHHNRDHNCSTHARKHSGGDDNEDGSPRQARVHMPSLFGMIGAISAVATLPLFPLLHYANIER